MAYFRIKILTPTKVVTQNLEADCITLSTNKGQIQLLPGHTHFVGKVEVGMLLIQNSQKLVDVFLTHEGICRLMGRDVVFLIGGCEHPSENTLAYSEEMYQKALKDVLNLTGHSSEYSQKIRLLKIAEERLSLKKQKSPAQ
jgi:F0F1-type ATP synthase epsilon subunit